MLVGTSDLCKSADSVREPPHHANQQRGLSIWLGPAVQSLTPTVGAEEAAVIAAGLPE